MAGGDDTEHAATMAPSVDGKLARLLFDRTGLLGTLRLKRRPLESGRASALLLQNAEEQARQSGGSDRQPPYNDARLEATALSRRRTQKLGGNTRKSPNCDRCSPAVDMLGSETVARDERDDSYEVGFCIRRGGRIGGGSCLKRPSAESARPESEDMA